MYKAILDCGELVAQSRDMVLKDSVLDPLEEKCWELFKRYCDSFNMKIAYDDGDSYKIDFDIAKIISESVFKVFQEMGFKLKDQHTGETILN